MSLNLKWQPLFALAALLAAGALIAQSEIRVTPARTAGAPLDLSILNETEQAIRQATLWLLATQHSDGSWGASNLTYNTALILFTLAATKTPSTSLACGQASLWLNQQLEEPGSLAAHAWRLLALHTQLPSNATSRCYLEKLAAAVPPELLQTSSAEQWLWQEALSIVKQGSALKNAGSKYINTLADHWPTQLRSHYDCWKAALMINRHARGQLVKHGVAIDWRRQLARKLINSQKRAVAEGGYWSNAADTSDLAATAFGLLTLLELR